MKFFKENPHQVFTASSIVDKFQGSNNVGASTIYRNLASLEHDGEIRKVANLSGRETHYQYIDAEHCRNHIHLICNKCNNSIHMKECVSQILTESLLGLNNFAVDNNSTIIYGTCDKCSLLMSK